MKQRFPVTFTTLRRGTANILSTEAVEGMLIDLKVKGNAERPVQVCIILVLVTMVKLFSALGNFH